MGRTDPAEAPEVDAAARRMIAIVPHIEAGEEYLDLVFTVGAQRILARIERSEQRGGSRR